MPPFNALGAQDGYDSDTEVESSDDDDDYINLFDLDQFRRDGNDIRFQLPSQNPNFTLSKTMEDIHRKATTIKRRKTTKSVLRRKSTKSPTLGTILLLLLDSLCLTQ